MSFLYFIVFKFEFKCKLRVGTFPDQPYTLPPPFTHLQGNRNFLWFKWRQSLRLADKLSTTFLPRRSLSSAFDILASFIITSRYALAVIMVGEEQLFMHKTSIRHDCSHLQMVFYWA
ncbi:hypothetical protein D5086_008986 [Populus alba]|uniref:Uncharacterized protein n=1 Tax=Populus alba TaxID=43335 RepID=A0ACC4CHA1_POPAL